MTGAGRAAIEVDAMGRRVATSGIDVWDVTAQLESRGVSQRVAEAQGHGSVFDLAERVIGAVPGADLNAARERHPRRSQASVRAAIERTLVMVAGIIICATSLPRAADEIAVFMMAAGGWLAGQTVSAATWHAWGAGTRRDGLAAGGAVGLGVLVLGLAGTAASGWWEALIWIGIGISTPLLLLLCNGAAVVLAGALVSVVCLGSWFARNNYDGAPTALAAWGLPSAVVATVVAVVLSLGLVVAHGRGRRVRYVDGTPVAVAVALLQTLFQLTILLQIFLGVGAGAFGAVALAVVAGGVLTDPLLTIQMAWAHSVAQTSASWQAGRVRIGVVAAIMVLIILATSAATVVVVLLDPYRITLNQPAIVAAALLCSAVISATNILLRTGSSVGAMLFAALAELLVVVTMFFPSDEPIGFVVMAVMAAVVIALALYLACVRFGHPSTW